MKTCLGWDWKVREKKLRTFLATKDRSTGAVKFCSINEPECIFEFSTKIITLVIGALMPVGMGKGRTFEDISIFSGNFSS